MKDYIIFGLVFFLLAILTISYIKETHHKILAAIVMFSIAIIITWVGANYGWLR